MERNGLVDRDTDAADVVDYHFLGVERLGSERRPAKQFTVVEDVDPIAARNRCRKLNEVALFANLGFVHFRDADRGVEA